MKEKTIKRVLRNKIQAWINSVDDIKVKEAIKRSSIVTGGSIPSMLLGEEVNDYDVYFTNVSDLKIVVEYYVNPLGFTALSASDIKISVLRSKFKGVIESLQPEQVRTFIPSDGFYAADVTDVKEESYKVSFITDNAISLTDKLQIVTRFTGEADKIHKNFDFVHATSYYTSNDNKLCLPQEALISILTKDLKYIGSLYPVTSVIRAKKFTNRGWRIGAGEHLKIMFQISELDLTNIKTLEEQLIGVDIAYFAKLIEILKNSNKEKITYGYLFELIERVFGDDENEEIVI